MSPALWTHAGWLVLAGRGCSLWHPPFCIWETEISSKFKQWDSSSGCQSSVPASPRAEDGCPTVRCGSCWPVSALSAAWEGKTAAEQLLPLASPHSVVFSHPIIFFFFLCLHQVFARQMGLSSAPAQPDSRTQRDAEGCCAATHLLLLPPKQGRGTRGEHGGRAHTPGRAIECCRGVDVCSAWSPTPAETAYHIWQLPKRGDFNPESSKP